jgi:predicted MFS family arabinose efflux permease
MLRVAESKERNARRPDLVGFALFTLALASLVYGLIESNERSWTDGVVLGALIASGLLLIAFVVAETRVRTPMFDLALFRKPTFVGGSVTAFGLSASIFSLILYLVLYLQDVLRYSALQTGVRLLVVSGGILLTSTVAGRLTSHVPTRFLIGPGLVLVGVGLLLMRGLTAASDWTDLIPGLAVSGAGVGLVNPPLASTAIGVVRPQQAGMASGINSTFRQVGIATGIALLGTLFSSRVTSTAMSAAQHVAALHGRGPQLATAIRNGSIGSVIQRVPGRIRGDLVHLTRTAFTSGLNHVMLVAAIIALASAAVALATIRRKDFAQQQPEPATAAPGPAAAPAVE